VPAAASKSRDQRDESSAAGEVEDAERDAAANGRLQKRWIVAFTVVMGARATGLALLPILLVEAPLLLLLLSPILTHLVLTGAILSPWIYFSVGIGTSIVQSLIAYWFGLRLGERAQLWLEGRGAATHALTTRVLGWMKKAAPVVLIAMAGPPVCALAGVSRVRAAVFYPAMLAAQLVWVGACYWFGAAVTEQVELVRAFVAMHLIELTALGLALVGGRQLWKWQKRQRAVADQFRD
jgi:membrane protein DedA with SNARE-associated domain